MVDWVKEWQSKVYPLRVKFGFHLIGAWMIQDENRFLWILGWDGPRESFEEVDRVYYDSRERKALEPDPARHLEQVHYSFMTSVVEPYQTGVG
jgi:hypothetical protein